MSATVGKHIEIAKTNTTQLIYVQLVFDVDFTLATIAHIDFVSNVYMMNKYQNSLFQNDM